MPECNALRPFVSGGSFLISVTELLMSCHLCVLTGEEDEERVFCHRAKLFRFDVPTKQWKERGIGEMKLLKHQAKGKKIHASQVQAVTIPTKMVLPKQASKENPKEDCPDHYCSCGPCWLRYVTFTDGWLTRWFRQRIAEAININSYVSG